MAAEKEVWAEIRPGETTVNVNFDQPVSVNRVCFPPNVVGQVFQVDITRDGESLMLDREYVVSPGGSVEVSKELSDVDGIGIHLSAKQKSPVHLRLVTGEAAPRPKKVIIKDDPLKLADKQLLEMVPAAVSAIHSALVLGNKGNPEATNAAIAVLHWYTNQQEG